jgi:hypothetical protein
MSNAGGITISASNYTKRHSNNNSLALAQKRCVNQWDRREDTEINLHTKVTWPLTKIPKTYVGAKTRGVEKTVCPHV